MQQPAVDGAAASGHKPAVRAERTQPGYHCTSAATGLVDDENIYTGGRGVLVEGPRSSASQSARRTDVPHFLKPIHGNVPRGIVGRRLENPTSADLLHYIRAMAKRLRGAVIEPFENKDERIERLLGVLLRNAMDSSSALDIVVTLGCAAELSFYPEDVILEQCTTTVRAAGKTTLVGAVWAVRHRCARAGNHRRRFAT